MLAQNKNRRHRLTSEALEPRTLMAADLVHNFILPHDVNDDSRVSAVDALVIINRINDDLPSSGLRSSSSSSSSDSGFMVDVNDDSRLSVTRTEYAGAQHYRRRHWQPNAGVELLSVSYGFTQLLLPNTTADTRYFIRLDSAELGEAFRTGNYSLNLEISPNLVSNDTTPPQPVAISVIPTGLRHLFHHMSRQAHKRLCLRHQPIRYLRRPTSSFGSMICSLRLIQIKRPILVAMVWYQLWTHSSS
jgi:hypothetical protein